MRNKKKGNYNSSRKESNNKLKKYNWRRNDSSNKKRKNKVKP